MTAGIGYF